MSGSPEKPLLSVVIPCFNEESVLPILRPRLTQALDRLPVAWELIFVDDGSTDQTPELLADLLDRVGPLLTPQGLEARGVGLVFQDPLPGKAAVLDFHKDIFHLFPDHIINNPGTPAVVAILSSVAH